MAITLTAIDIYYNESPKDCIVVRDDTASPPVLFYIPWDHLSIPDRELFTHYVDTAIFTQSGSPSALLRSELEDPEKVLPNGMTAWSTYKYLMRHHPTQPEAPANLLDIYYDGSAWRYTSTGDLVP